MHSNFVKYLLHLVSLLLLALCLRHHMLLTQLMEKVIKKSKKVKAKEASGQSEVPVAHLLPTKLLSWESQDIQNLWVIQEG